MGGHTRPAMVPASASTGVRAYLKHSTVELNEAAFLLGYEDSNSFFRAFHGWEGTSPGEWRTRHRQAAVELVAQ